MKDYLKKVDLQKILVKILIFCIIFMLFNKLYNSIDVDSATKINSFDEIMSEIDKLPEENKFFVNFDQYGNYIIWSLDEKNLLNIFMYSDEHKTIDTLATIKCSENINCVMDLYNLYVIDNKERHTIIIGVDGSVNKYENVADINNMTVSDIVDNKKFFEKYSSMYDVYYFYEDTYIYRKRPDFISYIEMYKNNECKLTDKIVDISNKNKVFMTKLNTFVDEDTIPKTDEDLKTYIEKVSLYDMDLHSKIYETYDINKVKCYSRSDIKMFDKETLKQILEYMRYTTTKSNADYIKIIIEKEYEKQQQG